MNKPTIITGALFGATASAVLATVLTQYDSWNSNDANVVPDGRESVAFGTNNVLGNQSLAGGNNNTAAARSIAIGMDNSSWNASSATGFGNYASDQGLAVGSGNTLPRGGMVAGVSNTIHSSGSYVFGVGNASAYDEGDGRGNFIVGNFNTAGLEETDSPVDEAVLIGEQNFTLEDQAWVLGKGNVGQTRTVTVGTYADPVAGAAFIVGTGTGSDAGQRTNGLIVKKNGDIVIPKAQGDISMGNFQQ